jgi:type I restriction enzyme S subunit
MLPDGWRNKTLGECARFLSGNTPSKEKEEYWGGSFPWVTVKDIKNFRLEGTSLGLTDQGRKAAATAPAEAVLVLTRGMALLKDLPVCVIEREMAFNQDLKALVPNEATNGRFLAYQLLANKNEILSLVDMAGHGTGRLDTDLLKSQVLAMPTLREQERIVRVIATWDQAIDKTNELLANSRRYKQSMMQQLVDAHRQKACESGGWQTYQMADLFAERVEVGRTDLPLLSITRDDGVINREDVGRKDTSNEDKSKYLHICPGDIGYNTMRMWQGVSALSTLEGIVSPAYTIVTPGPLIDGRFASYLFKLDRMVFEFYRYSQGLVSDTWNLKYPHFAKIKVTIPARAEQEKIVAVLSAADATIAVLVRAVEALQLERSVLMGQLFNGKRRISLSESKSKALA